jgi:hypothetical protein
MFFSEWSFVMRKLFRIVIAALGMLACDAWMLGPLYFLYSKRTALALASAEELLIASFLGIFLNLLLTVAGYTILRKFGFFFEKTYNEFPSMLTQFFGAGMGIQYMSIAVPYTLGESVYIFLIVGLLIKVIALIFLIDE